jgi:NAD(P)-dependent dehydrogenase (short-subunit alcohol dehydrogenase family)
MTLRGKVALVTRGSRGIGRAIWLGSAGQGAQMMQVQGGTALGIKCDVAQVEDIHHLVDTTLACLVGHHDA